jgi:hypothetical protein
MLIKIPLEEFIDLLMDLYEKGADFVDIYGVPDQNHDYMSVGVRLAYINPDRENTDKQIPDINEETLEDLI